jgi:acyl-coenzyme A thioesterase PaaI-like protein
MLSLSAQRCFASRLAPQAQRRIAVGQPHKLTGTRQPTYQQHQVTSRRPPPAASLLPPCSHGFSTSPPLLLGPPAPNTQPPSSFERPPRRGRPGLIAICIFFALGIATGTGVRAVIAPPPPVLPGSELDESLTADIRAAAAQLPVVKQLLSDPEWASFHHDAYEGIPTESRPRRITTGPLAGTRGVGAYQHVFHNRSTGEVVSVVFLGPGTIGWPGVVHGGVIATLLDEHSARAALKDLGGGGVLTANLDITYKRPTLASDFYVLRAHAVPEEALPPEETGKRGRKVWVDARIETVDGKTCVECRSLFVSPKSVSLRRVPENF